MQAELDRLELKFGSNNGTVQTPYFRPDALEQASALHAMATSMEVQDSHEELEQELEQQQRAVNPAILRWFLIFILPAAGGAGPLLGLAAFPS